MQSLHHRAPLQAESHSGNGGVSSSSCDTISVPSSTSGSSCGCSAAPLPDGGNMSSSSTGSVSKRRNHSNQSNAMNRASALERRKRRERSQAHLHPSDHAQQRLVYIGGRRVVVGTSLVEKVVLSMAALGWAGVVVLLVFRNDGSSAGNAGYYADERVHEVGRMHHRPGQYGPHHGDASDEGPSQRWQDDKDEAATLLQRINPFYLDVHDHSGLAGDPVTRSDAAPHEDPYAHSQTHDIPKYRPHPHPKGKMHTFPEGDDRRPPPARFNFLNFGSWYNKDREDPRRPRRHGPHPFGPGGNGNRPQTIVESPSNPEYIQLRQEFDALYPETPTATQRRINLIDSTLRKREYQSIEPNMFNNDPERDCPFYPPEGYPVDYPTVDIINNWNPDNPHPPSDLKIYQGLCVFDYHKDYEKAQNYRRAEVPFIVRNDPEVVRTVERWNHPDYLKKLLKQNGNIAHRAEYSKNNHFMYWMMPKRPRHGGRRGGGGGAGRFARVAPEGWTKPTELIRMTYEEWIDKANVTDEELLTPNKEHWYFRLIGCGATKDCDIISSDQLFEELPFFQPRKNLYMVEPGQQRGIHCRFGMQGVVAENHFDGSRNAIALLGGERRYILSHPAQCPNLALYPMSHPSGRHSEVDWTNPDLDKFPQFAQARSNEVVLQAGDVLYLPTNWFHFIVSLNLNFQCNSRSGISDEYMGFTKACGF